VSRALTRTRKATRLRERRPGGRLDRGDAASVQALVFDELAKAAG